MNRSVRAIAGTLTLVWLIVGVLAASPIMAQTQRWAAAWAASAHGPYPSGNPSAQPVLDFAIESATTGANDQSFRLIIRPSLWGKRARLRFSNAFGTRPVTFDNVYLGLQSSGGNVAANTNARVRFNGKPSLTVAPGQVAYSDTVNLPFVKNANAVLLAGRKLAVSFHVVGASGPITWHAKALQTSYLSAPHSGSHGQEESDASFPYTTTSWYFLDALDVQAPAKTVVVACFGDSITDGTNSTLNGDDRWPDFLSRRLAAFGNRVSVINAGIGGNQITGPANYLPSAPVAGGPSALDRLERDVLSLSGVTHLIWLEGINDLSRGASAETVIAGMQELVKRVRARGQIKIIGATITSSLGSNSASGTAEVNARRQTINQFIRTSGLFDGVADFDAATVDPQTGALRPAFQPNSTIGGAGDKLHPNRAGYQAMANAIDWQLLKAEVKQ